MHPPRPYQPCPSSLIGLEKASYFLFTAYCRAKEENNAEIWLLDKSFEVDANKAYLYFFSEDLGLDLDSLSNKDDNDDPDNWEDVTPGSKKETRSLWMDIGSSLYAKEKLVRILASDNPIPKQWWSLCRILATLIHYQKD